MSKNFTITPELLETYRALRGVIANPETRSFGRVLDRALEFVAKGRKAYFNGPSRAHAQSEPGMFYLDNPAALGFRHVGDVSPEGRSWQSGGWQSSKHREGYTTDPHGGYGRDDDGLVWGAVYQLPGRDGCARFVAGIVWGHESGDGVTLDLTRIYTGSRDDNDSYSSRNNEAAMSAAKHANGLAESAAEREREYQAAWQCGLAYGEALEEATATKAALRALLAERRGLKHLRQAREAAPNICAAIETRARQLLRRIGDARTEAAKALQGEAYGLYVWLGSDDHKAAFVEAAGLESFPGEAAT